MAPELVCGVAKPGEGPASTRWFCWNSFLVIAPKLLQKYLGLV